MNQQKYMNMTVINKIRNEIDAKIDVIQSPRGKFLSQVNSLS